MQADHGQQDYCYTRGRSNLNLRVASLIPAQSYSFVDNCYGHSPKKYVHEVLVNHLVKLAQVRSVVR